MDENAFTYADPADPLWKRALIGAIEAATGRDHIKRLYLRRQAEGWGARGFYETALSALSLDLRYDAARLDAIPKSGPLVVVANHPFGVLDGIAMAALMARVRPDFRLLTNAVLLRAPELREHMLPIDFSRTPGAARVSAESRRAAIDYAKSGGCVVVFPAGAVSTSPDFWGRAAAIDGPWTSWLARLVAAARGPVVPIYFVGQNSRLFQIASHIHLNLRLALFFHEVRRRIGTAFPVEIGAPISWGDLASLTDKTALTAWLRAAALALAPKNQPRPR